jgi:hypothetical protein
MKKNLLLGAILVLGSIAYGQANQTITPVLSAAGTVGPANDGTALTLLPVEVSGEVFDLAELSMVVTIHSAPGPTGTGFAFDMPDLFITTPPTSVALPANFDVELQKNGVPVAMTGGLLVDLLDPSGSLGMGVLASGTTGTTLDYVLTGSSVGTLNKHVGTLTVTAHPGTTPTAGTYSDSSVDVKIELTGQGIL